MDTLKIEKNNTKLIAHRGLSGIECENTLAAFIAAGNRSYFGIETDVHKTADGKYIIIHDDNTGRVSNENVIIEKTDYDTLRNIKLLDKDGNERPDLFLPLLEEYLKICKRYDKVCVLELKNPFEKQDINEIVDIVKKVYSLNKIIFISFSYENLVFLRQIAPNVAAQYLYSDEINNALINKLLKFNFGLDIYYKYLNKRNIDLLHSKRILINCWTCDNKKAAGELIKYGVDYITSNILE